MRLMVLSRAASLVCLGNKTASASGVAGGYHIIIIIKTL